MGLPIWRDPEENKQIKDAITTDPTAASRSSIRRRPSIHGRRSNRGPYTVPPPPPPPRGYARSPPPSYMRSRRYRDYRNGVPPISTLLESADRVRPPPPPVPESRNYFRPSAEDLSRYSRSAGSLTTRRHEAEDSLAADHAEARRETRERDALAASMNPVDLIDEEIERYRQQSALPRTSRTGRTRRSIFLPSDLPRDEEGRRRVWSSDRGSSPSVTDRPQPRRSASGSTTRSLVPPTLERSPPAEISAPRRPDSRDATSGRRNTLPTPPLDTSERDSESLFMPEGRYSLSGSRSNRISHPLSNVWRPDSPIDGLGDRNRSPTPNDGWEIMRATITPDVTLPSADSSFTSAAASNSFSSSNDTTITDPQPLPPRRVRGSEDEMSFGSSDDDGDFICIDDDASQTSSQAENDELAMILYEQALESSEGRARIEAFRRGRGTGDEPEDLHSEQLDLGHRLLEESMQTPEGRENVEAMRRAIDDADAIVDDILERQPERYSQHIRDTARNATERTAEFFRDAERAATRPRALDNPPPYEPLSPRPVEAASISQDRPVPHPVNPLPGSSAISPTTQGLLNELNANIARDEDELERMRRIVERLARRDDVPEEWWMSVGLRSMHSGASRRARSSSARQSGENASRARPAATLTAAADRVRSGRVERGNSRL